MSVASASAWINVADRLPDHDGSVLAVVRNYRDPDSVKSVTTVLQRG